MKLVREQVECSKLYLPGQSMSAGGALQKDAHVLNELASAAHTNGAEQPHACLWAVQILSGMHPARHWCLVRVPACMCSPSAPHTGAVVYKATARGAEGERMKAGVRTSTGAGYPCLVLLAVTVALLDQCEELSRSERSRPTQVQRHASFAVKVSVQGSVT